jgi:hypothetical protein
MSFAGLIERRLFTSHELPSRSPSLAVGKIVTYGGRLYRVTRWVELPPVALDRGGSVGEWQVWGRRVSDRQLRREVVSAAEAILDKDKPLADKEDGWKR